VNDSPDIAIPVYIGYLNQIGKMARGMKGYSISFLGLPTGFTAILNKPELRHFFRSWPKATELSTLGRFLFLT